MQQFVREDASEKMESFLVNRGNKTVSKIRRRSITGNSRCANHTGPSEEKPFGHLHFMRDKVNYETGRDSHLHDSLVRGGSQHLSLGPKAYSYLRSVDVNLKRALAMNPFMCH